MYTDIKKMIKNSSSHNIDKPELASDWSTRRQKIKHTHQQKFMQSLRKVCDENVELQNSFDILKEIREFLISEADKIELDHQLSSFDVVPLAQIIESMQMQRQREEKETAAGQPSQKIPGTDVVIIKTE